MDLLGFNIYTDSKELLIDKILNSESKIHIISGNAEVLKYPLKDVLTAFNFKSCNNVIIPDGISVSVPLKVKYKTSINRITGIDLMTDLLVEYEKRGDSVYFLGAKADVLEAMITNLKYKYPKLNIVGYHHGYIDTDNCEDILREIQDLNPKSIFIAMGTPIQENFIFKYMNKLPCTLFMGVGGSFDVLSGNIKRSPNWIRKIGFEWLYRIVKDPSKLSRLWNNLFFTIKACLKR